MCIKYKNKVMSCGGWQRQAPFGLVVWEMRNTAASFSLSLRYQAAFGSICGYLYFAEPL